MEWHWGWQTVMQGGLNRLKRPDGVYFTLRTPRQRLDIAMMEGYLAIKPFETVVRRSSEFVAGPEILRWQVYIR